MVGFNKFGGDQIKGFFYSISSPFQKIFWQAGQTTAKWGEAIWKIKTLKEDNENLILQKQELMSINAQLRKMEEENRALREALGAGMRGDFQLMLSQIVSKDISQDSFRIDKGAKDGLIKDMPVVTSQKVLLGKINKVSQNYSEMILISHPESTFDVKIQDKEAQGVIKGGGDSQIALELITREQELQVGDAIVTTALGGLSPPGLLIGQIESLSHYDIDPFQGAAISPAFNINQLSFIFVITGF